EEAYLKVADGITESDSDFDGLPDFWETRFFGDLSQGSADNDDNDGLTNLEELFAGRKEQRRSKKYFIIYSEKE
ncbi:hypothetical protein OAF12_06865, partial [Akkermansiaceae bacterium]|nr:hypothetical protein [Akkermansiaceae bacterium]